MAFAKKPNLNSIRFYTQGGGWTMKKAVKNVVTL